MASLQIERNLTPQRKNPKSPASSSSFSHLQGDLVDSAKNSSNPQQLGKRARSCPSSSWPPSPTPTNTVKPPSCPAWLPGVAPTVVAPRGPPAKGLWEGRDQGHPWAKLSTSPVHCSLLPTPVFKRLLPRMDWVLGQPWSNPPALLAPVSFQT